MAIVIMKCDSSPIAMDWTRPHCVWVGNRKQAIAWCKQKNDHPNNLRTVYSAVTLKELGPEGEE